MAEVCKTCSHPLKYHASHGSGPDTCRPPDDPHPKHCGCSRYIEDASQLTTEDRISKIERTLDVRLAQIERSLRDIDQKLRSA